MHSPIKPKRSAVWAIGLLAFILAPISSVAGRQQTSAAGNATTGCSARASNIYSLPTVLPSTSYASQNDPELEYRRAVLVSARGTRLYYNSALRDFVSIRSKMAEYAKHLANAEKRFWSHYDRTGRVDPSARNEFAYWLHKRRVFDGMRANLRYATRQGGGNAQVLPLLFGQTFSEPNEVYTSAADFSMSEPVSVLVKNAEYRAHFRRLSINSFLNASACAPKAWNSARGRMLHSLLSPTGEPVDYRPTIEKLDSRLRQTGQSYDDLDRYVTAFKENGSSLSSSDVIANYANARSTGSDASLKSGQSTAQNEAIETAYRRLDYNKIKRDFEKSGTNRDGTTYTYLDDESIYYLDSDTISFPPQRVSLPIWRGNHRTSRNDFYRFEVEGMAVPEFKRCYEAGLKQLNAQLHDRHKDEYVNRLRNIGVASAIRQAAGISCSRPDGLNNKDVHFILQKLRLPLR